MKIEKKISSINESIRLITISKSLKELEKVCKKIDKKTLTFSMVQKAINRKKSILEWQAQPKKPYINDPDLDC